MAFSDLGLSEQVLRAVSDAGYAEPTPIQRDAIPVVLTGRDMLGCAQTGTGKTASFTLPMIDVLAAGQAKARMPRSLILEPTRELAAQVADNFELYGKYCKLSKALLIGGESLNEQAKVLDRGVDVLIATPGRLIDIFERGRVLLNDVRILVIDEADRMLDMGFIPDVERIASLVSRLRQTLLFSATMPPEIRRLANAFLTNPKEITVAPPATPAENVHQGLLLVKGTDRRASGTSNYKLKRAALRELLGQEEVKNALVFCNRKRDVGILCRSLQRHGFNAAQLHGDMPQSARMETLDAFKQDKVTLLVCSDVAARGLDIKGMSHVFNFDVPTHPEDYIHRIGRTGRAGQKGRAFTLALPEDSRYVASIEKLIGGQIARIAVPGTGGEVPDEAPPETEGRRRSRSKPSTKKDARKRPRDSARSRRDEEQKEPESPVRGLGNHVPAFLLRDPMSGKKMR